MSTLEACPHRYTQDCAITTAFLFLPNKGIIGLALIYTFFKVKLFTNFNVLVKIALTTIKPLGQDPVPAGSLKVSAVWCPDHLSHILDV